MLLNVGTIQWRKFISHEKNYILNKLLTINSEYIIHDTKYLICFSVFFTRLHTHYTADCVQVPVTQRPYTVHVPQNVPVNFVPVSVPRQELALPGIQVIEQNPFTYCEFINII